MTDKIWIYAGYAIALWFVWKFFGGHITSLVNYTSNLASPNIRTDISRPRRESFR